MFIPVIFLILDFCVWCLCVYLLYKKYKDWRKKKAKSKLLQKIKDMPLDEYISQFPEILDE
jgi:hypothetical protein